MMINNLNRKYDNKNRKQQEEKIYKICIRLDEATYTNLKNKCADTGINQTEFITSLINNGKINVINAGAELASKIPLFEERLKVVEQMVAVKNYRAANEALTNLKNDLNTGKQKLYKKLSEA